MTKPENPNDSEELILDNLAESNLKGYLSFFSGQVISLLGSSIVQFVIIWWITIKTSAFFLVIGFFLGFGTTIALTPIAGVYVDRWSRKKIIGIVDFLQAFPILVLIYLFMAGIAEVWHVLIVLAFRGAFAAFHEPAVEAIIPLLVPRDKLSRINGLAYLMNGIVFIIGPAIGALLFTIWDGAMHKILWLDVVTFLIAIVPLIFLKIPSVKRKQIEVEEKPSFKKEFKEGISFIKKKKGLLTLLILFATVNFFAIPLFVLLPWLVYDTHGGNEINLALLMALQQGGMLLGGLFMTVWKGFKRNLVGVIGGIFFAYLGIIVVALAPKGEFLVMGIGLLLIGVALPIINVSSQTIWQQVVPPEILGRVFSVRRTISQFTAPLAMGLSAFIILFIDAVTLITVSAIIGLALLLYSWFMTELPKVEEVLLTRVTALQPSSKEKIEAIEGEIITPEFMQ